MKSDKFVTLDDAIEVLHDFDEELMDEIYNEGLQCIAECAALCLEALNGESFPAWSVEKADRVEAEFTKCGVDVFTLFTGLSICQNCDFYAAAHYDGKCRRKPPLHDDPRKWPSVKCYDWCGEYAPRKHKRDKRLDKD